MKAQELKQGYQAIENKDWGFAGDKSTWAKLDGNILSVKKAQKGIISSAYAEAMQEFCSNFCIDFSAMKCGEVVKVTLEMGE